MNNVSFSISKGSLADFNRTLNRYAAFSRRETKVIVDTKAFYIARRAVVETEKANKQKILAELRGSRMKSVALKKGGFRKMKYSLAQLIIIARRGAKGQSTKKSDIREDVAKLKAARGKSVAFLKSGWLPAIKKLEPLADRIGNAPARPDSKVKQYGRPKGHADPARENTPVAVCRIVNDALPKVRSNSGLLSRIIKHFHNASRAHAYAVASKGLERAINFEKASMLAYIEKKLRKAAERAQIKAH